MKVLLVSAEVTPFAKVGGLADVAGSLPKALHELGVDIRVLMPKYRSVVNVGADLRRVVASCAVEVPGFVSGCAVDESRLPGTDVPIYFVEHNDYFWRDQVYGPPNGAYPDNLERLSFLCRAVPALFEPLGWQPDVVHLNDWHTSLIAVLAKERKLPFGTVFTGHNLGGGYQGVFPPEQAWIAGIDESKAWVANFLGEDGLNLARAGLTCADMITTVSPTYARELKDPDIGAGVHDLIRERGKDVRGVLNGIDYDFWNPGDDVFLAEEDGYAVYSIDDTDGKTRCKAALQAELGLPVKAETPVLSIVTRLDDQKGLDLVEAVVPGLRGVQLVVLGTGAKNYEEFFAKQAATRPEVGVELKFDEKLAHRIYAGSDIFLMPSRFEPCGLGQMISLRYGTVPVVRKTGGLSDTVHETGKAANGFVFGPYDAKQFRAAIDRAVAAYKDKEAWAELVARAMKSDNSWAASAKRFVGIYEEALAKAKAPKAAARKPAVKKPVATKAPAKKPAAATTPRKKAGG
jgi:starch synthase